MLNMSFPKAAALGQYLFCSTCLDSSKSPRSIFQLFMDMLTILSCICRFVLIRLWRRIVQFWPWKRLFLKFGHCSFLLHLSLINDIKTEFIVIGTRQLVSKVDNASLKIGSAGITPLSSVRNLDAWFDDRMAMNVHVGMVCKKAFKGLYNIRQIRKLLSVESTKTLIHAFVTCHLDYCNSIVWYQYQYQCDRLQRVLNAAARVTCLVPRYSHITPVLALLHWLPIRHRIEFKIALMVLKARHGLAPNYICELLSEKPCSRYSLRSADEKHLLAIPKTKSNTLADRAFFQCCPNHMELSFARN